MIFIENIDNEDDPQENSSGFLEKLGLQLFDKRKFFDPEVAWDVICQVFGMT